MASESILGEILSLLGDVSREVSLVVPKKAISSFKFHGT